MAEKVNIEVNGVIENMSWFTGDDGKKYELFGSGGGQLLADELNVKGTIISLDGLQLREFDYVDIGEVAQPANVVPVVVKSLLFASADKSVERHHHHLHHHHHDHDHSGPHDHSH